MDVARDDKVADRGPPPVRLPLKGKRESTDGPAAGKGWERGRQNFKSFDLTARGTALGYGLLPRRILIIDPEFFDHFPRDSLRIGPVGIH